MGRSFTGRGATVIQKNAVMKIARVYMRVSTKEQDIKRQDSILQSARSEGYYIAGIYRDIESGVRYDRPELMRMLNDLQPGDVIIAERMDRLSRGPLEEAEKLVATIKEKGAKLSVPGVVDLSDVAEGAGEMARIFLQAAQETLLKVALLTAREDWESRKERQRQGIRSAQKAGKYKGRRPNKALHERIVALRTAGQTITETARIAPCSPAHVKRVWAAHLKAQKVFTPD